MDTNKSSAAVSGSASHYELGNKRKEVPEPEIKDDEIEVKEVNGTNGRKKLAVCSTSSAAAASGGVSVTDDSGDLASVEMTFSIDHIREQLFRFLPNQDLYNCRLVCRIWNSFASLELQNRIKSISFYFEAKEFLHRLGLFNNRPDSMLGLPLPCSKFSFDKRNYAADFLKNRAMLNFLNKFGSDIQELSFSCEWCDESQAKENEVIDFVTNLLLHQTPNLLKLEFKLEYSASWAEGGSTREYDSTLLATDPEFKEIHSKTCGTNTKLKVFSLTGVSAKLLETVIQLAPNLREINARDFDTPRNDCKYFMEPLNRLGYLKNIDFEPDFIEELEDFEKICELTQTGDASLKLRELSFCFERNSQGAIFDMWSTPNFLKSPDMRVRGVNVINRLLECSWNSLETIMWDPVTALPGLKWPEALPNVQKLTIKTQGHQAFPEGFPWSTTFPKLRSLSLNDVIGHPGFTIVMDMCFQNQKIESVKFVHVHACEDWSLQDPLTGAQFQRLQNIFPNAVIEISVPLYLFLFGGEIKFKKRCKCRM